MLSEKFIIIHKTFSESEKNFLVYRKYRKLLSSNQVFIFYLYLHYNNYATEIFNYLLPSSVIWYHKSSSLISRGFSLVDVIHVYVAINGISKLYNY